jgi:hypothetical protein
MSLKENVNLGQTTSQVAALTTNDQNKDNTNENNNMNKEENKNVQNENIKESEERKSSEEKEYREEEEELSPEEKAQIEEELKLEKELANQKKKFNAASIEDIQREIGEMAKKIEHEKINLRIVSERYNKKFKQYCELQGKPVAETNEEKEKKEKITVKKTHKLTDPIVKKQGKDKILMEEQEKSKKIYLKSSNQVQKLSSEINDLILTNDSLKKEIEDLRKQKNIFIKQREELKEKNKEKENDILTLQKLNEISKNKIKVNELQNSIETSANQQKKFEETRDALELEYHKIIEEFIRRQREEKKEAARKRQMAIITNSGGKSSFKGKNVQEIERQIKALKDEEISDRTPIIEEIVHKWRYINKFKKHMIEKYTKNSEMINEAFSRIIKFLGLDDVDELPIVYKKIEDQMSNIGIYLSRLENEENNLEDEKKILEDKIKFLQDKKIENKIDEEMFIKDKEKKINDLMSAIEKIEKDVNEKKKFFVKIQPLTDEYLKNLNSSILADYVINKMQIDEKLAYNENTVNKFISNVEDYYNLIQMFNQSVNEKNDDENKEFDKLRNDIKLKLKNFEKNKILNKNFFNEIKSEGKNYDEIIKLSSEKLITQLTAGSSSNLTSLLKNTNINNLNKTNSTLKSRSSKNIPNNNSNNYNKILEKA